MPNIREYDSPINEIHPSEQGPAAYAQIAQSKAETGKFIGGVIANTAADIGGAISAAQANKDKIDKAAAQKAIAAGGAALAALDDNLSSSWMDAARGGDPHDAVGTSQAWREKTLEPQLDAFTQSFPEGPARDWAMGQANSYRSQYFRTTSADAVNLSNAATANDFNATSDGATDAAYKRPDTLPDILGRFDATVDGLVNNSNTSPTQAASLGGKDRQAARTKIVQAAALGWMRQSPQSLIDQIDAGQWDHYGLSGQEIDQMRSSALGAVQQQKTTKRVDDNNKDTELKRVSSDNRAKTILGAVDPKTGTWTYSQNLFDQITNLPPDQMTAEDKLSTIKFLKDNEGKPGASDTTPGLMDSLMKRVNLPATDPNHLTEVELQGYIGDAAGKTKVLSNADYNFVHSKLTGDADSRSFFAGAVADTLNSIGDQINQKSVFGAATTPAGNRAEDEMRADARRRLDAAPDLATQRKMIDPNDPLYIFKPDYIKSFADKVKVYGRTSPLSGSGGGTPGGFLGSPAAPAAAAPTVKPTAPTALPPLKFGITPGQQGALDTGTTGGVQLASFVVPAPKIADARPATIGTDGRLFSGAPVQQAVARVTTMLPNIPATVPSGKTIPDLVNADYKDAVALASDFLGQDEVTNRVTLSAFMKQAAGIAIDPAQTAWCAAWANAVLAASGYATTVGQKGAADGKGMWAFDFEKYGTDARGSEAEGDIATFRWKNGGGHVGFFMGYQEVNGVQYVRVLGGNQSGSKMNGGGVSISLEPADQMSSVRHPVKLTV